MDAIKGSLEFLDPIHFLLFKVWLFNRLTPIRIATIFKKTIGK